MPSAYWVRVGQIFLAALAIVIFITGDQFGFKPALVTFAGASIVAFLALNVLNMMNFGVADELRALAGLVPATLLAAGAAGIAASPLAVCLGTLATIALLSISCITLSRAFDHAINAPQ